jgi:hypothetical protein
LTSDEVKQRVLRAHAELQAIGDEHVDLEKEMGQDIALADINALRDGSQAAWDERATPRLAGHVCRSLH